MSDPASWYPWIKVAAFIAGLVFGAFAVGSPSWVWLKRQLLTVPACVLAALGTSLIGMSVWQSVDIEGPGFKAILSELENLETQVVSSRSEMDRLSSNLTSLQTAMNERVNVERLTSGLRRVSPAALRNDPTLDFEGGGGEVSRLVRVLNDTQDIADALRDSGYSDDTASRIAEDIQKAIFQNNDVLENATLSEDGIRKVKTRLMGMNYTEEEAAKAIDALDDARGLKFIELMSWPYGWRSIYMD